MYRRKKEIITDPPKAVSQLLWPDKDREVPGFPVKFVGVDKLHAAFLMKAAHAAVAWCLVQEIRVCGFPWEKTTKRPVASVYTNCETAVIGPAQNDASSLAA
jgi:hypothetical protein